MPRLRRTWYSPHQAFHRISDRLVQLGVFQSQHRVDFLLLKRYIPA